MTFFEGVKKAFGLGDSTRERRREAIRGELDRENHLDDLKQNLFDFNEKLNGLVSEAQEAQQRGNLEQLEQVMVAIHNLHENRDEVRNLVIQTVEQGHTESMEGLRQRHAELSRNHTGRLRESSRQINHEQQVEDAVERKILRREGEAGRKQVDKVAGAARAVAMIPPERLEQYMGLVNAKNVVATQGEASLLKRMQAHAEQGRTSSEQQKEKER